MRLYALGPAADTTRGELMAWPPYPFDVERYCVESGRAVSMIPGDRCTAHGAAVLPCATDVRPARCKHLHPSPNHPTPTCSECGREIEEPR